jgi:hypothetical protein
MDKNMVEIVLSWRQMLLRCSRPEVLTRRLGGSKVGEGVPDLARAVGESGFETSWEERSSKSRRGL